MKPNTELKVFNLRERIAKGYSLSSADATLKSFAAIPSVEQTLQDKITEQSDFLQRINILSVDEKKGEKILGSASGSVSSRTDTSLNDRTPKDVLALNALGYELFKTESDVAMKYETLDAWAKFKYFHERYRKYVQKQIALDRIKVGFHGTSVAVQTDIVANPNLEDLNKGWLQHVRDNAPAQIFDQGAVAGQIRISSTQAGADFVNLDQFVHAVAGNIGAPHQESGDLIAIIGSDLLSEDKAKLYAAQGGTPTEKERIESQQVIATYGGLPAFKVPFFPARGLFITSWDNLSIYIQSGSWRRQLTDNPKRDRFEDFNRRNEGYIVEDYEKFAAVEFANVKLTGEWI